MIFDEKLILTIHEQLYSGVISDTLDELGNWKQARPSLTKLANREDEHANVLSHSYRSKASDQRVKFATSSSLEIDSA